MFYIAMGGILAANNGNQVIMNMRHGLLSKKHGESCLLFICFAFLYSSYEIVQHFLRLCAFDRFFFCRVTGTKFLN